MPKYWAHGVTVSFGGSAIANLTSVSLPDENRGVVDITDNASVGNVEKLPGMRDGGQVTLDGLNNPGDAGQAALRTNYAAAADVAEVIITLPAPAGAASAPTYTFQGFVVAMGGDNPQQGSEPGTFNVTIEVSGEVAFADGSAA